MDCYNYIQWCWIWYHIGGSSLAYIIKCKAYLQTFATIYFDSYHLFWFVYYQYSVCCYACSKWGDTYLKSRYKRQNFESVEDCALRSYLCILQCPWKILSQFRGWLVDFGDPCHCKCKGNGKISWSTYVNMKELYEIAHVCASTYTLP